MAQILDYSAGYPGGQAIANQGFGGAARYLPKEGGSIVRPITAAELRDLTAHNLGVTFIAEHRNPARPLDGYPAGVHDAQWFWAQAKAIMLAAGRSEAEIRALYFACDTNTTASNRPATAEYYLGVQDTIGRARTGCYGEYDLIDYLVQRALCSWFWQTYAWSIGHNHDDQARHPSAHLFQRLQRVTVGGIDCDVNDVLKTDYGQINYQEGDMPLNSYELGALERASYRIDAVMKMTEQIDQPLSEKNLDGTDGRLRETNQVAVRIKALEVAVAEVRTLVSGLSDDEVKILAAIRDQPTGGQVDVPALAKAINALGTLVARVPDDQIERLLAEIDRMPVAVREQLAAALAVPKEV